MEESLPMKFPTLLWKRNGKIKCYGVGRYKGLKLKQQGPRTLKTCWIFGKLDKSPQEPMELGLWRIGLNPRKSLPSKAREKQGSWREKSEIIKRFRLEIF
jgi:hypothetical protein